MFLVLSCSWLFTIYWSQVLSREWGCSWSSADRRCPNYIWVINNWIVYQGTPYIRDLMVFLFDLDRAFSPPGSPYWDYTILVPYPQSSHCNTYEDWAPVDRLDSMTGNWECSSSNGCLRHVLLWMRIFREVALHVVLCHQFVVLVKSQPHFPYNPNWYHFHLPTDIMLM